MRNDNEKLYLLWNMMRGTTAADQFMTATILLDEVKNTLPDEENTMDNAYIALLAAADKLKVNNPFQDRELFFMLLQEMKKLKRVNWEYALEQELRTCRYPLVPEVLVKLLSSRMTEKPETVLIGEADKFVPHLTDLIGENLDKRFTLTAQNIMHAEVLKRVFADYENVEVVVANIYQYEFVSQRYDLIFASPAFNGRNLAEDQTFICREYDMVALENLSLHLNSGGELVIILPGRITFASGRVNDLRQFIQQNYTIKELAELPEGIFEYTGIKTYLLDIENCRPGDDDITIRRYSAGERKSRRAKVNELVVEDDTFVLLDELLMQGDWNVSRFFEMQDEEWMRYQNSGTRKEQIGDVARVFRGKTVTQKDPNGGIGVVNISNIGDYEIDYDGLDHIDEEERKVANYLLQEGDVLLPARGTAIRTAIFRQQKYPCIASSNVIVIRPDAKLLDGLYLKIFLDSPLGNKMISSAQQGMTVMNISYKDLNVLEIPIPPLKEQQCTATEYAKELKQYRETVTAAEERWKGVLKKLQKF